MVANRIPYGVGLAYRPELHREIMRHADELDVLEIATVDYLDRYWRMVQDPGSNLLKEALERFPAVAHGINMSIGSVEPHDELYLRQTRRLLSECGISSFSEHLAFHRMDGNDTKSFIAMPFEEISLRWLEQKYNVARSILGRSIALENVSYYFLAGGCALDEANFITEMTRRTDCTILLDVTNVFNNAHNHGYDGVEYIRSLPGNRIEQLHIAGGKQVNGKWIDSHSAPVMEPVWELVDAALQHTAATMIFLERDTHFDPFDGIMKDIRTARSIFSKHRPLQPPAENAPQTAASEESTPPALALDAPEFANLRSFQRAIMRQITDPNYRRRVAENPNVVQQEYPMSADWQARWASCDQGAIGHMARVWPRTKKEKEAIAQELKRLEWQLWASQV